MGENIFIKNTELIKKKIYTAQLDDLDPTGNLWTYLMVSCNLSTFMPNMKSEKHFNVIQDIQFHRELSEIEQYYPHLLDKAKITDKQKVIEQCYNKAHIFVSYHIGSYNLPIRFLAQKHIPFCLVTSSDYIAKHEKKIQKLVDKIPNTNQEPIQFLSAEDPKLIFKLLEKIKNNISIYFFIDGNMGSTENKLNNSKNLLKTDFLEHHIYARVGISFLAYLSKAPLVRVISTRDANLNSKIDFKKLETQKLLETQGRKDFTKSLTKILYKELENNLTTNFKQWGGWFYVQNFFDTNNIISELEEVKKSTDLTCDTFVTNQFIHLVKVNDENIFLVMKKGFEVMKIKNLLYDVLTFFKTPKTLSPHNPIKISNKNITWTFINELINSKFLKPIS